MSAAAGVILQLVKLARPHHWIKNVFIVVPVPFAVMAGTALDVPRLLLGLLGFSLVTSAVYIVNDIKDAAADRLNPEKKTRPIACGAVSPSAAAALAATLMVLGIAGCWLTGSKIAVVLTVVYIASNLAYSFHLKHVPLVDVFLLASGYVIRVLLGCALIGAAPSGWLLICASALALFLAFTKRRADLIQGVAIEHRPALAGYTAGFLEQAMAIMCGMTLLAYALYSIEGAGFVTGRELAGMPFVAFALLHYLRVAYKENRGSSPVDMALRSAALQACAVSWLVATIWSLGVF